MEAKKKRRLEENGWRVGSVQEFLGLSDAEAELVEMHVRLSVDIKRRIDAAGLTQAALAKKLRTSTSRLSHMLSGNQVSTDALVRALFVLGATSRDIGKVIGGGGAKMRTRPAA